MSPPALRHVLMTADTIGGVWTFASTLSEVLGQQGVNVTLVTMGRLPDDRQVEQIRTLGNVTLVPTSYRLEWMQACDSDLLESRRFISSLARQISPDVVHSNTYLHASLSFDAPVLLTAHSCVSSWWRACRAASITAEWAHYEQIVSHATRSADMLVAPTAAYLAAFCALHGAPKRARVIWNGSPARLATEIAKDRFVFAAGRLWDEAKNIGTLCRAISGLDIPLFVAGDQVSPDGSTVNLEGAVTIGHLGSGEMREWMSRALIFASPARYEPFGLTILEAALCGCALVLSDIPTLRELWEGAAIFVDSEDVSGWRRALSHLSNSPGLAALQGRKARERARRYSAERMASAYIAAYKELVGQSNADVGVAA